MEGVGHHGAAGKELVYKRMSSPADGGAGQKHGRSAWGGQFLGPGFTRVRVAGMSRRSCQVGRVSCWICFVLVEGLDFFFFDPSALLPC